MNDLNVLLQEYRNQVETIDREILYLLSRRQNLVASIGHIKEALWTDVYQPWRWQEVLDYVRSYSLEFWVEDDFASEMWEVIHKYSLKKQSK